MPALAGFACAGTSTTVAPSLTDPATSLLQTSDASAWLAPRPRDLSRGSFKNLDGARFAVVTGANSNEAIALLAEQPWQLLERQSAAKFSAPPLLVAADHVLVLLRGVAIDDAIDRTATTDPGRTFVLQSDDGSIVVRHSARAVGAPVYRHRPILASLPRPPTRLFVEQVTVRLDSPSADVPSGD